MDSSNYLHPHYHHLHDYHCANGSSSSSLSSSSPSSSPSLDNPSSSTSSSSSSSRFGVVLHPWTPNNTSFDEATILKSSRSPTTHENFNPMSQNPGGFQWPELGDIPPSKSFPKFTDMLINETTSTTNILDDDLQLCPSSYVIKSNNDLSVELSQKLMLKNLLSSTTPRSMELDDDDEFHFPGGGGGGGRGFIFSQIHPSVNISKPTQPNSSTVTSCNSLDSNWPTFDLLSSARFSESGNCGLYDHGNKELFRTSSSSSSFDHVSRRPYSDHHKTGEAKRPSSSVEAKSPPIGSKKTRLLESRPSYCPPMKVRKEKLGDRIAALQQLVAPFGKTHTASVLMEAIGYIKFLQNQIQTLSVLFMKSQPGGNSRTSQRGTDDPTRTDLRSRGLCLVPLTCMSYVTNDGLGVSPPPSFR